MPVIEDLIRQAIEAGKFSDLSGKGKPLRLDDNPHSDPAWRLAYHLLRENGFTLPWLERRREIEAECEQACQRLRFAWSRHTQAAQNETAPAAADAEWQQNAAQSREQFAQLNRRIFDYNLQAPAAQFQMIPLDFEREIQRICESGGG
ncbi:MAG: hypothetical protein B6D39_12500 [Anaerolineae bacterium UTCFX2]|nr:DUF1992 domain-containing protein [Anaerolineae bacterium]MCZ7552592.1 DUF1992 domain-containing protein [Anaerolineales bacterium]OQY87728.1 MAG: hypothetical protein B6D39_12500 [Anaerolineae bacterium UTCFX2]